MMMMMMNPSGKLRESVGMVPGNINWNVVSWKEDGSMQNPPLLLP